ncbi:DUF1534 domain-containing protein [Pseudomonas syringae pv. actinidiae]|nr:DUF1534 domain-containing protein [Pseudomonas syringae pv. actinidiae]
MSCVVRESNLISPRCTFKIGRRASRTACDAERRTIGVGPVICYASPSRRCLPGRRR